MVPSYRADLIAKAKFFSECISDASWKSCFDSNRIAEWVRAAGRRDVMLIAEQCGITAGERDKWLMFLAELDWGASAPDLCKEASGLPFIHAIQPFIATAVALLHSSLNKASIGVSSPALSGCTLLLARRLSAAAADTLYVEFCVYKTSAATLPITGTAVYREFIVSVLADQGQWLSKSYPALLRLLCTLASDWVDYTLELLVRAESDANEIAKLLRIPAAPISSATCIYPAMSDPHDGGRSVHILEFGSARIVYKPRQCDVEDIFGELCSWFSTRGLRYQLKTPQYLLRPGYAWVEFIPAEPISANEQVFRYFTRVGYLLFLVHLLAGTDCHLENLIASAEFPVIIDLETLFHPQAGFEDPNGNAAFAWFSESVICTGLLPRTEFSVDGKFAYDTSALATRLRQTSGAELQCWQHVNSDNMLRTTALRHFGPGPNVAQLDHTPLQPLDHLRAITSGFKEIYQLACEHRLGLLSTRGPIERFKGKACRHVFRPTPFYYRMLERSTKPDRMVSGFAFSVDFQRLWRNSYDGVRPEVVWSEQVSLERLDVPKFTVYPGSLARSSVQESYRSYIPDGLEEVRRRVRHLGLNDLCGQLHVIRASILCAPRDIAEQEPDLGPTEIVDSLECKRFIREQALRMARQLRNAEVSAGVSAGSFWLGLRYSPQSDLFEVQPLGIDLYEGGCGLAVLFAGIALVQQSDSYLEAGIRALGPLSLGMTRASEVVTNLGIGAGDGLSGCAYALAYLYAVSRRDEFAEMTLALMRRVHAHVPADNRFDLLGGSAGVIVTALAVRSIIPESFLMDLAVDAGEHLLAHRVSTQFGCRAWKTIAKRPLAGASHGAAGIALALMKLGQATGDKAFIEAAQEACEYERALFCVEKQDWPDLRDIDEQSERRFVSAWCHGAPGILLSRVAGLGCGLDSRIRADIEAGSSSALRAQAVASDTLCCGHAGRAETVGALARVFRSRALHDRATAGLWAIGKRFERRLEIQLAPQFYGGRYAPGFFQGISGVAYTMLRAVSSDYHLPGILTFDELNVMSFRRADAEGAPNESAGTPRFETS